MLIFEKGPMLYNGIFGCHGNICWVILMCNVHITIFAMYIIYVQSMCVPILRSIGTKLTNLENMQKSYVLFDVMWRKNSSSHVIGVGYFCQEHFEVSTSSVSKVMAQTMVFMFIVTLTLTFDFSICCDTN